MGRIIIGPIMHNSFQRRKTINDWKKEQEENKWPKNKDESTACTHLLDSLHFINISGRPLKGSLSAMSSSKFPSLWISVPPIPPYRYQYRYQTEHSYQYRYQADDSYRYRYSSDIHTNTDTDTDTRYRYLYLTDTRAHTDTDTRLSIHTDTRLMIHTDTDTWLVTIPLPILVSV